jgi:hypothetical protein
VELRPGSPPTLATAAGTLARLPSGGEPAGIAVDHAGRFGGRIVVALAVSGGTQVDAVDCGGHVALVAGSAPPMEGGMAIAPPGFGVFGGRLIGADEATGRIIAVGVDGAFEEVDTSGLPVGAGVGPESVGFAPPGFRQGGSAAIDAAGGPQSVSATDLNGAGVAEGDLLVVAVSGETIDLRCSASGCLKRGVVIAPTAGGGFEGNLLLVADHPGPAPSPLPPGTPGAAQASGPRQVLPYAAGLLVLAALFFLYWRQIRRR